MTATKKKKRKREPGQCKTLSFAPPKTAPSDVVHTESVRSEAPPPAPKSTLSPEYIAPAGVDAIGVINPESKVHGACKGCDRCGDGWSVSREIGDPVSLICYRVSDIVWPVVDFERRDIWPVIADVLKAWLCPNCYADVTAGDPAQWAWDFRQHVADKQWKAKSARGVAESFREAFDEIAETWAAERWADSIREECERQYSAPHSPNAVAMESAERRGIAPLPGVWNGKPHGHQKMREQLAPEDEASLRAEIAAGGGK